MKIVSLLLSLCLASVALADDPAELVKLRKKWENSVAGGQARAKALYLDETNKANMARCLASTQPPSQI